MRTTLERAQSHLGGLAKVAVSEITPSRRDFSMYVNTARTAVARVPLLPAMASEDLLPLACRLDDEEVAGLAMPLDDPTFPLETFRSVASAVTAPILRSGWILGAEQLFQARAAGADAVILPLRQHQPASFGELVDIAVSLHLDVVVEAGDAAEIERASMIPRVVIGVRVWKDDVADADASIAACKDLPARAPGLCLTPLDVETAERLMGVCDSAIIDLAD